MNELKEPKTKTVKEFKEFWGISDETFRGYRKTATDRTGFDPVRREGSKTWLIVDEQAVLDAMPAETKERKLNPPSEVVTAAESADTSTSTIPVPVNNDRQLMLAGILKPNEEP